MTFGFLASSLFSGEIRELLGLKDLFRNKSPKVLLTLEGFKKIKFRMCDFGNILKTLLCFQNKKHTFLKIINKQLKT